MATKQKDFKALSKQELNEKLNELHKQFMELQFKRRSGVEKPHMFKLVRKDIARILTIMNAKQMDAKQEGSKTNIKQETVASTRPPKGASKK